jgi:hypothetical protein
MLAAPAAAICMEQVVGRGHGICPSDTRAGRNIKIEGQFRAQLNIRLFLPPCETWHQTSKMHI